MGLFKAYDTHFVTVDGLTKTSGGGANLANGQVAFVNLSKGATKQGAVIEGDFDNISKRDKLQLRMGKPQVGVSRSLNDKPYTSPYSFTLDEIVGVRVDAPKMQGQKVDDFILGYDGTAGTEIDLDNGDNFAIQLALSGNALGRLGYKGQNTIVQVQVEAPNEGTKATTAVPNAGEWTVEEIVENAVEEFKRYKLLGDVPLTDLVDIIAVNDTNVASVPNTQFYNLALEVDGTFADLGRVQAQYPTLEVVQSDINADFVTYTVIAESLPAAYVTTGNSILKGCADCPAGYTELNDGFVYQVVMDGPTDQTATVQAIPGAEALSAVLNATNDGQTFYSVVTDDALTQAEIDAYLTANLGSSIELIAEDVVDFCQNTATTSTVWVAGANCEAKTETYTIRLADDECGSDKLTELQAAYEDLTVSIAYSALSTAITLTGTSGTANVSVEGVDYLATFNADLTTTASDFVTAHAAAILAASGWVVTANAGVLTFTITSETAIAPTITNATGDLSGTIVTTPTIIAGLCQTTYKTTVTTNVVCDECSDEFRDLFTSEAPADFEYNSWKKEEKVYNGIAKMGIRFRGKQTILSASEDILDDISPIYDSVRLAIVAGYPIDINENWNFGVEEGRVNVKLLSRFEPAQNLGMHLRCFEEAGMVWFDGHMKHTGNNYAKYVFGDETRFDGTRQYVDFVITTQTKRLQGGVTQQVNEKIDNHIWVPVGRHTQVEDLLNSIATAASLPGIQAFARA